MVQLQETVVVTGTVLTCKFLSDDNLRVVLAGLGEVGGVVSPELTSPGQGVAPLSMNKTKDTDPKFGLEFYIPVPTNKGL